MKVVGVFVRFVRRSAVEVKHMASLFVSLLFFINARTTRYDSPRGKQMAIISSLSDLIYKYIHGIVMIPAIGFYITQTLQNCWH
jgi:hypothetical protein